MIGTESIVKTLIEEIISLNDKTTFVFFNHTVQDSTNAEYYDVRIPSFYGGTNSHVIEDYVTHNKIAGNYTVITDRDGANFLDISEDAKILIVVEDKTPSTKDEEKVKELKETLKMLRGQYSLFVGPDDAIANTVLSIVDKALKD